MKNYERVTPHDRIEMLNFNQSEDMTRFYMYALRCFDLENQIENGELLMREETINTTGVTYLQTKIQDLEKENAELKAGLEKAVELPCKVGDTVWFFNYDNTLKEGKISMLQCKADGKWKMRISYEFTRCKTVFDDYCNEIGKKYFTDRTEAEARLKEIVEDGK